MGRPSKLTDAQWEAIGKRLLAGESAASLAREYGVSKASISTRFSKRIETVKNVANQIVATESALSLLNVPEQIAARSLADELKAISMHLAGAAKLGAMISHRMMGIAQGQVDKVDDADPMKSADVLASIAVLAKTANLTSEIGVGILRATKDVKPEDDAPAPVAITFGVKDAKRHDDDPV